MRNLLKSLVATFLGFSLAATAHAQVTVGSSNHFRTDTMTQVVIEGGAAEALYKDLSRRRGVEEIPCRDGKAVVVAPFICLQSPSKTICVTQLFSNEGSFQASTGMCEGPNPSIIGVGNGRPKTGTNSNLKLNPLESK